MEGADAYAILAEGHGEAESVRYRRILEFLLTPPQARPAAFPPEPAGELAVQEPISRQEVQDELEFVCEPESLAMPTIRLPQHMPHPSAFRAEGRSHVHTHTG